MIFDGSLISVIIPVYKVEEQLERCISSITNQTYSNLEIILVDDGSPDGCPALCNGWVERDGRVRVIHQNNAGLSAARNAGIDIASGEYIAFVDSDDFVEPDYIEALYGTLTSAGADFSCCGLFNENELLEPLDEQVAVPDGVFSTASMIPNSSFYEWQYVVAWNKLYKREVWDTLRYPVDRVHEDEFVYHHLLLNSTKVACTSRKLYHYVRRADSIMGEGSPDAAADKTLAMLDRTDMLRCAGALSGSVLDMCAVYAVRGYLGAMRDPSVRERMRGLSGKVRELVRVATADAFPRSMILDVAGFRLDPYWYARVRQMLVLPVKRIVRVMRGGEKER